MTGDLVFHQEHKDTRINYQISQSNQLDVRSLILLAAFSKHSGDPYLRFEALMEIWSAPRWLYVAIQLHGVE